MYFYRIFSGHDAKFEFSKLREMCVFARNVRSMRCIKILAKFEIQALCQLHRIQLLDPNRTANGGNKSNMKLFNIQNQCLKIRVPKFTVQLLNDVAIDETLMVTFIVITHVLHKEWSIEPSFVLLL